MTEEEKPTAPPPPEEEEEAPERKYKPIAMRAAHFGDCPNCHVRNFWTGDESFLPELHAAGYSDWRYIRGAPLRLSGSVVMVYPVRCVQCSRLFISHPADQNPYHDPERWKTFEEEVLQYNPDLRARISLRSPDTRKYWDTQMVDRAFRVSEFVEEVVREPNRFVRAANIRRIKELGYTLPFPEDGDTTPSGVSNR